MVNIDDKLAEDTTIKDICPRCDNYFKKHACIECATELKSSECKEGEGMCEECLTYEAEL